MICNMDSIGKYMLEIILHQQRTSQLLKQKKLMQTQEDHSNPIQALNVDSFKVDLVVIQNTCSEKEDSNSDTASSNRFKRAFMSLFGQDADTFTSTMLLNVDQLQKQLDKDEFQEDGSMAAFWVYFVEYTRIEVKHFKDTLLHHMGNVKKSFAERTRHQRRGIESEVQDDSSRSGNDTDTDDADIRPIYDEEPMAEVQLTTECNIFAIGQQHTKQPEIINEGRVDQYIEQCQVKSHMLDSSPDNQTTEYSKQSLESENILLKKIVTQFQKDFSRMEAHCIALELKYQNQALKSGKHGQILNETNSGKGFCNCYFKHYLRKLKGNSVDTKFAKTSVLGKSVLQSLRNQSLVRQSNAFKTKRPQMSKHQFASQVDVNNNVSRPVTQHYLPKRRESVFAKPDHMIASSKSRNSSKNMPRFSSNDMVHNHYLDEARKKTQERDRNSKTSVMPSARFQSTTDDSKPKPKSTNHSTRSLPISKSSCVMIMVVSIADHPKNSNSFSYSKHFVCSTCHKCVFNANHDACITKLLKEVNSHAKIKSHKIRNSNIPVDQKSHTQKPGRQIITGHTNALIAHKTVIWLESVEPWESVSRRRDAWNSGISMGEECSGSDTEREQLSDASIEIKAYTQGLKKVEAQLVAHQQGQLCTETPELVSKPVVNESNVACQPKVWSDAPIVKTPRETVKNNFTHSKNPKVDKKELGETAVKAPQQVVVGDPKTQLSTLIIHRALQNKGIVDSGCSRHMTGNKAYLAEYQDFNGWDLLAFGGSKGGLAWLIEWTQLIELTIGIGGWVMKRPTWLFDLDYLTDSMNYQPVRSENQANQHAGLQEANQNADKKPVDKEDQVFLDELERLKRQEKDAKDADKYVAEILKKFDFINVKTASTPIETQKPLVKDEEASDVDVHLYRSLDWTTQILTRWEKILEREIQQRLVVQFLGRRLIFWTMHKADNFGTSTNRAELLLVQAVVGQVLWIQSYESSISLPKQGILAISATNFISDAYEKKTYPGLKTQMMTISLGFRESLGRALDGTEAPMLPKLFILWLATVSTDSVELVPMGKVSTAIETLKKNTAKETSGGNHGGQSSSDKSLSGNEGDMTLHSVYDLCISLCTQVSDQAKEIQHLKAQIKKLKKQAKPGRKSAKAEPSVHKDLLFDEMPKDTLDYMESEDAQNVGRTRDVVDEEKDESEDVLSTEDVLTTAQQKVSTDKEKVSTDKPIVSADGSKLSTNKEKDSSLNMSLAIVVSERKEKGVEFKDIEETERSRPTSTRSLLTLKPLPKIDPTDKGKKKIKEEDESESESDGIPEAERKFKQLASDEEMARKVQEEWSMREIQALYEKIKRSDEDFISIGSAEDERLIKKMNEKGIDSSKNESVKEEGKEEEGTKKRKSGHIKMIARKKPRKQSDDDSDDEHRKCLKIVTFESILDSEIMEKKSVIARLNKVSSPDGDYLVIYRANGNFRAFNYLMEILHIFDRQDLFHLYDLMREQYSGVTLEGYELILWGDLKIMMESSTEGNEQSDFWSGQQDWKIVTWRLYESCGVCILEFEDGIVIHMLVERRYSSFQKIIAKGCLHIGLEVNEKVCCLDLCRRKSKIDTSKAVDDDLVFTESNETESEVQDDNSRSGNDTDADDADIRPI
ncbi:hypothetical protein Tco_0570202 [Tanacetum coccineum]